MVHECGNRAHARFDYTLEALIRLRVLRIFVYTMPGDHPREKAFFHHQSSAVEQRFHLQEEESAIPVLAPDKVQSRSISTGSSSILESRVSLDDTQGRTFIQLAIPNPDSAESRPAQFLSIPLPEEVIVDRESVAVVLRSDHVEIKLSILASLGDGNWNNSSLGGHGARTPAQSGGQLACGGCGELLVEKNLQ
jgi:hypothetical protein